MSLQKATVPGDFGASRCLAAFFSVFILLLPGTSLSQKSTTPRPTAHGISERSGKIGVIVPLTGGFGYFGEEFRQGAEIALEELRNRGENPPPFVFEDDQCQAKAAVTAFSKLTTQDQVTLVVGPACSTSIKSVAPAAKRGRTPVLFLLDTGPEIADLPEPLRVFGFDPWKMARAVASKAFNDGVRNIAIITEEEEYSSLVSENFEGEWKRLGGTLIVHETRLPTDPDFKTTLLKTLIRKPDGIFFSAAYDSAAFLKQLRILDKKIPVYGSDTMCVAATLDGAGPSAEGAHCANVIANENSPNSTTLRAQLKRRFHNEPQSLFYAGIGHDAVYIAIDFLKDSAADTPTATPSNRDRLIFPELLMDTRGVYDLKFTILQVINGKLVPVD